MSNFIDYLKTREESLKKAFVIVLIISYTFLVVFYPSTEWIINNFTIYLALSLTPPAVMFASAFLILLYRDYEGSKKEERDV